MDYRTLGRTGIKVSQLCYGTMSFGRDADETESAKMYKACRDKGINFFDCANVYSKGRAEEILGKLINSERQDLIITSKCYFPMTDEINAKGANRRNIIRSVEESLKRLNTDYLDVYFMHRWDPITPLEEILRALEKLVFDGKVLYLGASNYSAWQIATALGISRQNSWPRFDVLQPMYSLVKRQVETEILPLAEYENLGVISYSPIGGGLLSGKFSQTEKPNTGRLATDERYQIRYGEAVFHETAAQFTKFAKEQNIHPVSLAVAWVSSHSAITSPIIGARNVDQLQASLNATDVTMTKELRDQITALSQAPAPATDRLEETAT